MEVDYTRMLRLSESFRPRNLNASTTGSQRSSMRMACSFISWNHTPKTFQICSSKFLKRDANSAQFPLDTSPTLNPHIIFLNRVQVQFSIFLIQQAGLNTIQSQYTGLIFPYVPQKIITPQPNTLERLASCYNWFSPEEGPSSPACILFLCSTHRPFDWVIPQESAPVVHLNFQSETTG